MSKDFDNQKKQTLSEIANHIKAKAKSFTVPKIAKNATGMVKLVKKAHSNLKLVQCRTEGGNAHFTITY